VSIRCWGIVSRLKALRAMILFVVSVLSIMLVEFHEGLANRSSSCVESANGGSYKQEIIP